MAQMVKNLPIAQETMFWFPSQEDPLEEEMATHSSILAWRIHEQRSLVGYSQWSHKDLYTAEWLTFTHNRMEVSPDIVLKLRASPWLKFTVRSQSYVSNSSYKLLSCSTSLHKLGLSHDLLFRFLFLFYSMDSSKVKPFLQGLDLRDLLDRVSNKCHIIKPTFRTLAFHTENSPEIGRKETWSFCLV